jgi:3-oxoacyl-[acyl-carrier-protein] synthase II
LQEQKNFEGRMAIFESNQILLNYCSVRLVFIFDLGHMEASVAFSRMAVNGQRPKRRVVITGIGVVSPLGTGLDKFWNNLLAGKTGIGPISLFDASTFPCRIAAEVKDFEPEKFLGTRQMRYYSRGTQFICAAFDMARQDANISHFDPYRTDVIMGTAISSFGVIEEEILKRPDGIAEYKGVSDPSAMFKAIVSAPATAVALMAETQSYVTTVSSACTSGINAFGLAYERIALGDATTAICGGVDTPINRLVLASFCVANFLTQNNDVDDAVCPFDERHTKSVLCEGAGVFILEELEQARARRAPIYAEVTGFNQETENLNELFLPDKSGDRWARAIAKTVAGKKIEHVNAHAPSDVFIDRIEAKALTQVFGSRKKTLVSSIKGSVGGNFTPAGVFQIASAAMTIKTGVIPPACNFKYPDPECRLNIPKASKSARKISSVLVNTRGVGSFNSSLLLEKTKYDLS